MNVVEPVATTASPAPAAAPVVVPSSPEPSTPDTSPTFTNQVQHTYPLLILAILILATVVVLVLTDHEVPGVILDAFPILVGAMAGVTLPRMTRE